MTPDNTGTEGTHPFDQPADQAERLRQLREDQRARIGAAGDDDGGRPYNQARATAPDAAPIVAPAWSQALASQPKEEPLGVNVHWLPDCSGVGGRDPAEWPSAFDPPTTEEADDGTNKT
jgi:hypothetical protein